MAYFKAVQHRAALAGLLVEHLHVKTEVVDLAGALKDAMHRVIDITPASYSMPTPIADETPSHSPVPDVFGD